MTDAAALDLFLHDCRIGNGALSRDLVVCEEDWAAYGRVY
jgi:hypothetical protein